MSAKSPCLILPMEIIERELAGNLLLASEAIARGWQCVIGSKRSIVDALPYLPRGVVFLKSIIAGDIYNIRRYKEAGDTLVSQDVEGLVYATMEEFVTVRFSPQTMALTDKIFFWGDTQRNALAQAYPADAGKMFVTGSPIAELWQRPELHALYNEGVEKLRRRYGRYIIIPSSFSAINHYMGHKANTSIIIRDRLIPAEKQEEFCRLWEEYERHLEKMFKALCDMLPQLSAAFPDHKIIVRPHPSESHESWKQAAKGLPNTEVIFEGPVTPWLLAADAVLHWGCTTGLEAYLMGRPVVTYNPAAPEEDALHAHKLPHGISVIANTPEETIEKIRDVIKNPDNIAARYPSVLKGREELAKWLFRSPEGAEGRIMDEIEKIKTEPVALSEVPSFKPSWKEAIWNGLAVLCQPAWVRDRLPERIRLGIDSRAYGRHKTRDIPEARIRELIQKMGSLKGIEIGMKTLRPNLYWLGPKNPLT